eukprot:scaffold10708_cov50-Attheya_sp.AAC.2
MKANARCPKQKDGVISKRAGDSVSRTTRLCQPKSCQADNQEPKECEKAENDDIALILSGQTTLNPYSIV